MPSFAASWESLLVFLVIVLLSAVSNWLKQRQARRQESEQQPWPPSRTGEPPSPPPLPTPQESGQPDWERELRRLFGDEPEPPPPTRPAPPPATLPPPLPPPPLPRAPERAVGQSPQTATAAPEPDIEPVALPPGTHFPPATPALDSSQAPEFVLAPMAESSEAWRRAAHLQDDAIARLHRASSLRPHPGPAAAHISRSRLSPEILRVRERLRHPRTAREVMVASVLLSSPRGLDRP